MLVLIKTVLTTKAMQTPINKVKVKLYRNMPASWRGSLTYYAVVETHLKNPADVYFLQLETKGAPHPLLLGTTNPNTSYTTDKVGKGHWFKQFTIWATFFDYESGIRFALKCIIEELLISLLIIFWGPNC